MRAYLPLILVALAVFTAACIAYVAWELSTDKTDGKGRSGEQRDADD
jgi:hypothetical protein